MPLTIWSAEHALRALGVRRVPFDPSACASGEGYGRGGLFATDPHTRFPRFAMLHQLAHIVMAHRWRHVQGQSLTVAEEAEAETATNILAYILGLRDETDYSDWASRLYLDMLTGDLGRGLTPAEHVRVDIAVSRIMNAGTASGGAARAPRE